MSYISTSLWGKLHDTSPVLPLVGTSTIKSYKCCIMTIQFKTWWIKVNLKLYVSRSPESFTRVTYCNWSSSSVLRLQFTFFNFWKTTWQIVNNFGVNFLALPPLGPNMQEKGKKLPYSRTFEVKNECMVMMSMKLSTKILKVMTHDQRF